MKIWIHWVLAALLTSLPLHMAHAADVVAVVVDFEGSAHRLRNGESGELKLGSTLNAGDEVTVAPGGSVTLRSGGRCLLVAEMAEPATKPSCEHIASATYRVEGRRFSESMSDRLVALSDVLSWWDPEVTRKPMRSRDSYQPAILALKDMAATPLVEGDRELHVRWVDGAPPFTLTLEGQDGRFAAIPAADDARRAIIRATIRPGVQYRLVLRDGTRTIRYALRGVAADEAGDLPETATDPLEQAAELVGAVSDSDGVWAFEALQRLRALPLEPRVKTALIDAIELGDWP